VTSAAQTQKSHSQLGPPPTGILDSGTTGHFLAFHSKALTNVRPATTPLQVSQANDSIITSSHTGELNYFPLPKTACTGHLFPELNKSLTSAKQFCDAGCNVLFTKPKAYVMHQGNILLVATLCPTTGLWLVPLSTHTPPLATCNAVTSPTKLADMIAFSHAALFSPALSTLQQALEAGYITGFPGLTAATVKKFPPKSIAMFKGHLDQTRKNQRSTKQPTTTTLDDILFPKPLSQGERTHCCYAATYPLHAITGQASSDLTGKFPVTSISGNSYVFLLYDFDSNCIFPTAIKNRTAESILSAYKASHAELVKAGHRPKLQRLDNECSQLLKDYMWEENIDFQRVPPGIHRRNAAERAIRTFKNHFIAGLSTVDPDFPMRLWDKLLPQAFITLNLLRGSRINPKLSAYAQIKGFFDFNKTPIAPPGIKVVVHEKPQNRSTWDAHAVDGFYLGPALESYRCYRTFISKSKGERITDTLEWFPKHLNMPTSSNLELLVAATKDLTAALKNESQNSPLTALSDSEHEALDTLNKILSNKSQAFETDKPPAEPAPPLRVSFETDTPPAETAPPLRVATPTPDFLTLPQEPSLPIITQEDEFSEADSHPTNSPETLTEHFPFTEILSHTRAPPGCGSKYTVKVDWTGHPPSHVPTNTFTENHTNLHAMQALAQYAQKHNLFNTSGWKCYKHYLTPHHAATALPEPSPPAFQLNKKQQHFFQVASHMANQHASANKAINPDTGKLTEYLPLLQSSDGHHWEESCCQEIGRLAQGYPPTIPEGTNTIHFIRFNDIPKGRTATYLRLVVADRPNKSNPYRVRFTVGGDRVTYPGDVSTKTAEMTTAKILINSTISTPDAKFMSMDIKDFYLNTEMQHYEYMFIPVKMIPQAIFDLYNLAPLVINGKVYVEIRKGMYGLPQAGRIANDKLVPILAKAGYHQSEHTPGLFKHESRPIAFCLVVDDFGVKYVGKEHALHLLQTLQNADYVVTTDWEGKQFCGITLNWDYDNSTVDLSMPGYIAKALQRFDHPAPTSPEDSPHEAAPIQYGAKQQFTADPDMSSPLDPKGIKKLQEIIGTLLYYARAIDNTMLVALGTLAAAQTKGTRATVKACNKLLNYAATHPDAVIRYISSDMQLHIHSDASYLSESQSRSRAGGFFFLSDAADVTSPDAPTPKINGAIHIISTILNNVMASATEAEVGALFHNAQDACSLRNTLIFLGHPQPATPIQTDNACAEGIINDTVKQKRSKAIDMRFYWVRDRVRQGQFNIHWKRGKENLGDYFTKHHPDSHHRDMRPIYLHTSNLALIRF